MMKTAARIFIFIFAFFLFSFLAGRDVHAQILTLDPASATKEVGEEFKVNLMINTENKDVAGADAKITFDSGTVEIVKIDNGDFFTDYGQNIGTGTLYITAYFQKSFEKKNGSGKMAILTLKGKKTGTAALNFACSLQTNDTNIIDPSAKDIIRCAGVKGGTYTFESGGEDSPTDVPSPSSTPTLTPTPVPNAGSSPSPTPVATSVPDNTEATPTPPVTGTFLPTATFLGLGSLLLIISLAILF